MVANGRHGKKCIFNLDAGRIEGRAELKRYIIGYYRSLFGASDGGHFILDETQMDDI